MDAPSLTPGRIDHLSISLAAKSLPSQGGRANVSGRPEPRPQFNGTIPCPPHPGRSDTSAPTVASDVTRQELPYRLRQQSLLGEFGRSALQTRDIAQILQRATELCAQGLETRFAKVLEYMPDNKRLLVRAGIGWASGTIGQVCSGVDLESPAGYAFQTGQMVISNHLQEETRFRTPKLLSDHGIRRAINVLIARGGEGHLPFGVLEVDSPNPANSTLPMRTSLPASPGCSASPSSANMPTQISGKHSTIRPC